MLFIRRDAADNLGVAFCATNVSGSCGDRPKSRSEGQQVWLLPVTCDTFSRGD